ncbi:MAG: hypothetical protein AB1489_19790, partial [Acidobacteriota bacterium]
MDRLNQSRFPGWILAIAVFIPLLIAQLDAPAKAIWQDEQSQSSVVGQPGTNQYQTNQKNEKDTQTRAIEEKVEFINDLLDQFPVREGQRYVQSSRVTLSNKGKLAIHIKFQSTLPDCVSCREEVYLR